MFNRFHFQPVSGSTETHAAPVFHNDGYVAHVTPNQVRKRDLEGKDGSDDIMNENFLNHTTYPPPASALGMFTFATNNNNRKRVFDQSFGVGEEHSKKTRAWAGGVSENHQITPTSVNEKEDLDSMMDDGADEQADSPFDLSAGSSSGTGKKAFHCRFFDCSAVLSPTRNNYNNSIETETSATAATKTRTLLSDYYKPIPVDRNPRSPSRDMQLSQEHRRRTQQQLTLHHFQQQNTSSSAILASAPLTMQTTSDVNVMWHQPMALQCETCSQTIDGTDAYSQHSMKIQGDSSNPFNQQQHYQQQQQTSQGNIFNSTSHWHQKTNLMSMNNKQYNNIQHQQQQMNLGRYCDFCAKLFCSDSCMTQCEQCSGHFCKRACSTIVYEDCGEMLPVCIDCNCNVKL